MASVLALLLLPLLGCGAVYNQESQGPFTGPDLIRDQCAAIGAPRVERISEHVWAAIGYDLANEILVHTPEGQIIIDPLMSPKRGEPARRDLLAAASEGPVKAMVYTHSHIDHVGGASLWVEDSPPIWASDRFIEHFFKQYQLFLPIEQIRGRRQFGEHATLEDLPCNGIGRRADIRASLDGDGIRLPNHTFSGTQPLEIGGVSILLIEAPGETYDQLMVWIPQDRTLIAADDFYRAFPNLYTIRGTTPRPIDGWIKSIDAMRTLRPEHLIPCHTAPIHGEKEIAAALTNYRDAIQWVRDEVVRGANRGHDLDTIAEGIRLPPHLAGLPYTTEFYGQIDWSAKGIYTDNLGWFDGRADKLYPMKAREAAQREIVLMGGYERVLQSADLALQQNDYRWSIHLLSKLADSGMATGSMRTVLDGKLAVSYEKLAATLYNLNGRGYLLEAAYELKNGLEKPAPARLDESLVGRVPLEHLFSILTTRLNPEKSMDVHETVHFVFPDEKRRFIITVRHGIAEAVEGEPIFGTPDPIAVVTAEAMAFRRMAMKITSPIAAFASGKIEVQGSLPRFLAWFSRFERD
jgi:alkyl sulfatase BDS1-like metallo-beta-lactamase superfamily hydrolase